MLDGNEESSVTQLNMGEGKTSLILPMLGASLAKTMDSCIRITVLKSLYDTNYSGLFQALGGILNQRVTLFPCARDLPISAEQAELVLTIHKEIVQRRGIVLTIPEYRLSWELKAYESSGKTDILLCQKLMDLVKWLHGNVRNILDESDEILSVKYQKVYALGLGEKIDEIRWKVTQRTLKMVPGILNELSKSNPYSIEMDNKKTNQLQSEVYTPCRLLNYTEESENCYKQLCSTVALDFIATEFPTLEGSLKGTLLDFLTNPAVDQETYDEFQRFCSGDAVLMRKFEKSRTIAELLVRPGTLQSALSKRWRVNYGVNPKGHRQIAVPFREKDVAHEKTEFGHPGMAIVLTQLSYYYSGLTDDQLSNLFDVLENYIDNPNLEFDSWISEVDAQRRPKVRYNTLNLQFPPQRKQVFDALRINMSVIDFWLSHCVFPKEIRVYPDKITCSAWDLCSSSKRTAGFSGTNDMSLLLPNSITPKDIPELIKTNEEVRTSVENCKSYQTLNSWVPSSKDILETLKENEIQVLIDAGALMIDMTNTQVADEWLRIEEEIEAVVYFNDKNQLTVRNREGIDCQFQLSPFCEKLDKCAVYLDDEHTRGTDLRFPDETVGCVTLGGRMTRDKLVQACMRLRLLESGHHKLFFLASREAHYQITKLIPDGDGVENPTAFNVMEWVSMNTREFIKEGMVFWANSALTFVQKRAAVMSFEATKNFREFAKEIQDWRTERSGLVDTNISQYHFVQLLPKMFDSVLSRCHNLEARKLHSDIKSFVMEACTREIPDRLCFANNLDEAQEREIEQEKEMEREVSRPRMATPLLHQLHPSIKEFILSGSFNPTNMEVTATPFKGLYATNDFLNVESSTGGILRPVAWVVSALGFNGELITLLLSPFEVNELVQEYRDETKKPQLNIHMFAPRLRKDQPILLNHSRLTLVGTQGASDLIEGENLAKLHIYAGSLYFDSGERANEKNSYTVLIQNMEKENPEFNGNFYIRKNIEARLQHFPEKSDVFKFLEW